QGCSLRNRVTQFSCIVSHQKYALKPIANAHQNNHYMRTTNAHLESSMQENFYDAQAPKKSTNLSINSDLLQQAKSHRINLSKALEQRLVEMLLEEKRREWREENREAIEAYNRRIEASGIFSDGLRRF
ncbi:MAG: type II toxin-antitoxin system CcdA family antitoxin, partial [Methylobacter sp.]